MNLADRGVFPEVLQPAPGLQLVAAQSGVEAVGNGEVQDVRSRILNALFKKMTA